MLEYQSNYASVVTLINVTQTNPSTSTSNGGTAVIVDSNGNPVI
jgi:hypothetical protein